LRDDATVVANESGVDVHVARRYGIGPMGASIDLTSHAAVGGAS
jgi:hypothetical protein